MTTVLDTLLVIHIVSGAIALVSGTVNMVRAKGGPGHRRVGSVFVYSMLTSGISAVILALVRPNPFLMAIGVFTVYLVTSAIHSLRPTTSNTPAADALRILPLVGAALYLAYLGGTSLYAGNSFGAVPLVFSVLMGGFAFRDAKYPAEHRIRRHIQRIAGAYIASLTAFLVVNAHYMPMVPPVVLWLLPTAAIVPLIVRWSRRYAAVPARVS